MIKSEGVKVSSWSLLLNTCILCYCEPVGPALGLLVHCRIALPPRSTSASSCGKRPLCAGNDFLLLLHFRCM